MTPTRRVPSSETTVATISAALREQILRGDLVPGQRLRTEALAADLSVSRSPVREALRQLAGQGLVSISDRRGARVIDAASPAPLIDLLQIRRQLEPWAAAEAATHHSPEDLDRIDRLLSNGLQAARTQDVVGAAEAHHDLLLAILEASGNDLLVETGRPLLDRTTVVFRRLAPANLPDGWAAHRTTRDAIADRDRRRAASAVRQHLDEVLRALARLQSP